MTGSGMLEQVADVESKENILYTKQVQNFEVNPKGLGYAFFKAFKKHGDKTAQICALTGRRDSYRDLLSRCIRTALVMKTRGIKKGDMVSTCSYNHFDSTVPYIAAEMLGCIVASFEPTMPLVQIVHQMKIVRSKIIFISDDSVEIMEKAMVETNNVVELVVFGETSNHTPFSEFLVEQPDEEAAFEPVPMDVDDTAYIFFSSGTTGLPKGIEHTHQSMLAAVPLRYECEIQLKYSGMHWIGGVVFVNIVFLHGTTQLVMPRFDPGRFWTDLEKYEVGFLQIVRTQLFSVLDAKPVDLNLKKLIYMGVLGDTVSNENLQRVRDVFAGTCVFLAYGQTETGGGCTAFLPKSMDEVIKFYGKMNSVGRPIHGYQYKVVDTETNETVGPNQRGELRLKSIRNMKGYYKMGTLDIMDEDGFMKTGDIVYYDEDFCFYVVDRIRELLKYKDFHVAPTRIESVLYSHPDVVEACVIGIPQDLKLGDFALACVVRKEGGIVTEKELEEYANSRLDNYHQIRAGVKFLESLPHTATDKINRSAIKKAYVNNNY